MSDDKPDQLIGQTEEEANKTIKDKPIMHNGKLTRQSKINRSCTMVS